MPCWVMLSQFIIKLALLERDEITHKYFGPYHLNIFHIKNKSTHPSVKTCKLYKLALDSDAFHIEPVT